MLFAGWELTLGQVKPVPTSPKLLTVRPSAVSTSSNTAARKFIHVANSSNTRGNTTVINSSSTNNNPSAILMVEQLYGKYNVSDIAVSYTGGKWRIVNQSNRSIPEGAKFNVLVLNPSAARNFAFTHTTTTQNTKGHITYLDHSLTNKLPKKVLIVTKRLGKTDVSPVGVWYTNGKWAIYNENRSPMPIGTRFNVVAVNPGTANLGLSKTQGSAFSATVTDATKKKFSTKHVSYLNNGFTNNQASAMVFATPVWKGKYNIHATGVWYDRPNWTVFNENRREIPSGVNFNYIALKPSSSNNSVIIKEGSIVTRPTYTIKPGSWQVITTPNRGDKDSDNSSSTSKEPEGPNLSLGKQLSSMLGDPSLLPFIDKLNLYSEVYEDKNPNSNVYYYLPGTYALDWNKENGIFALSFYYMAAEQGSRGDVIVTAEFSPKLNNDDIKLAEELLQKKTNKPIKLVPMPLRNTPKTDLETSLGLFDVTEVSVNIPSDILKPIVVNWKMSKKVDDLLGFLLSRNQVSANINFEPFGDDEKKVDVPLKMKINDSQTYGSLEFDKASKMLNGFQNPLDFPIVLESVGIIRNKNGAKVVESLSLNGYQVDPKAFFSGFSSEERNQILNGDLIEELWLNYSIQSDCEECGKSIKEKILGGTSSALLKEIQVEVLTPLEASKAQMIKLLVKSKQADPKGESEKELPIITITQDFKSFISGELFVEEGKDLDYQYKLVLIMPDAKVYESEWTDSNQQFLVLGESTISELFPELMGGDEEMEELKPEGEENPDEGND